MKGNVEDIVTLYDGIDTELIIPVYQRNYDWTEKQCAQLYDDLVEVIQTNREKHFFGAVVGDPETKMQWVVIDGQQRITTVSLLILALVDALEAGEVFADNKDLGKVLRRNYLEGADSTVAHPKLKLKPVKADQEAYRRLLTGQEPIERSNATANYRYFRERIAQGELTGDELWTAIGRLEAMIMHLERHDDPQRIFESLNSTGKSLTESDKIRNLVLMGQKVEVQEYLYEDYWNRVEINVDYDTDTFIRLYLVYRTRKLPRFDSVYEYFKAFLANEQVDIKETLSSLRDFSEYYRDLNKASTGIPAADHRLRRFNLIKHEVAMPTLMPLLADYRAGRITETDFAKSIALIDSYMFRRMVVGLQTNSLNKIFATLYSEARRIRHSDAPISDVLGYLLLRREGTSGAYPDDEWFRNQFVCRKFFNFRLTNRRYLFECLENLNSKDQVSIAEKMQAGDLSIEHIMPQTLTNQWRKELGENAEEIHDELLDTIGNLTITGYNSEYSNASFLTKKTIPGGFDESPYRLNSLLKQTDMWNEKTISARAEALAQDALEYWPSLTSDFEPIREPLPQFPMGDDQDFKGSRIAGYSFNDETHTVNSFKDMLRGVVKSLLVSHREEVFQYATAKHHGIYAAETQPNVYFEEITPGLWLQTSNQTNDKLTILRGIFDALNLETDDLVFTLRKDEKTAESEQAPGRYDSVVKFLPQFEDWAGTEVEEDDVKDVRRELWEALKELGAGNPQEAADGRTFNELSDPDVIQSLIAEEVLAAFVMLRQIEGYMPGQFLQAVKRGTISNWLQRLEQLG